MVVNNKGIFFIVAYIFLFFIVISPDYLPLLFFKTGYAWTPLNDFNYKTSDLYYYVYGIKEILSGNYFINNPDGSLSCEAARILPYWLAAVPFFVLSFEMAIPVSIGMSSVVSIFLVSSIVEQFNVNKKRSFFIGFVFLFYVGVWSSIPISNFDYLSESLVGSITNLLNISDYDHFNSNFRMVVLSTANIFLFLQILLGIISYKKDSYVFYSMFLFLSCSLFFVYPSFACIGCICIFSFCAMSFFYQKEKFLIYLFIGFITLLFAGVLLLYFDFFHKTYGNSHILGSVYTEFDSGPSLKCIQDLKIKSLFFNKYVISYLFFYFFLRKDKNSRFFLVFNGCLCLLVICILCIDSDLVESRMLARGIDIPWFLSILYSVERLLFFFKQRAQFLQISRLFKMVFVSFVYAGPFIGFIKFSINNLENNSRYYPEVQKQLVHWVEKNTNSQDTVAALDLRDAHFLTFSKGRFTNYISYIDIQKLSPEKSLERFIHLSKFVGMKEVEFMNMINESIPAMYTRITKGWENRRHPPFLKDLNQYQNSQVAFMMLYWPYVKSVWGIKISTPDNAINPLLSDKIRSCFLQKNDNEHLINYLILSKALYSSLISPLREKYSVAYENSHGVVFYIKRD